MSNEIQRCPESVVYADDGQNRIASQCELRAGHLNEHAASGMPLLVRTMANAGVSANIAWDEV